MQDSNRGKNGAEKKDKFAHLDMDTAPVVSSNDMTGLIQRAPKSDAELEAYEELYDYNATAIVEDEP